MTREQALKALEGTWMFREEGGNIALRNVELIKAVQAYEDEMVFTQAQGELIPQKPATPTWPSL